MAAKQPVISPVGLAKEDWYRAGWRNLPPLACPASPKFDREASLKRLAVAPENGGGGRWSWSRCKISIRPGEEEARFWLRAIEKMGPGHGSSASVARKVATLPDTPIALKDAGEMLKRAGYRLPVETWSPLLGLFSPRDAVSLLLEWDRTVRKGKSAWHLHGVGESCLNLNHGFQQRVLPYLTAEEREELRELLRPLVTMQLWPANVDTVPNLPLLLAASLGDSPVVARIVESWPDRKSAGAPPLHPQTAEMLFGLGSAEAVRANGERLRLRLEDTAEARAWLAHTELAGLDLLLESALAQKRKTAAEPLARVLALAEAPEAAPHMLQLMLKSAVPEVGRGWLEKHPALAARGLVESAAGRGKTADAAREFLESLRRSGHAAVVDEALASADSRAAKVATAHAEGESAPAPTLGEAAPEWLTAPVEPPGRPNWLPPGELPAITVSGRALTPAQEEAVLSALQRSTLREPEPLVRHLKQHADPHSLEAFAWRLCTLWQQRGRKAKEAWALEAVGLLGGDDCALKLGPLAKEWREKLLHRPAALAVDCLAAIGTDAALGQLRNFTLIPRDWSLKETAAAHLKAAARQRGITEDELEDRLVPDCGLAPDGSRVFDFGPRQFRLVLGEGLKPIIRDPEGKLRADLPKPNARDDRALAERSVAEWKLLKKLLAEVLKGEARRLELAMVYGRRWSAAEFEAVFLRRPVMSLLARLLVWAVHAPGGERVAMFRVAEDNTLADAADEPFALPPDAAVSLPHPLLLSEEERVTWGERLADYELTPPFPQIGRELHHPTEAERNADRLDRFNHLSCLAIALTEGLDRHGWRRGEVGGGGMFYSHSREYAAYQQRAEVTYEPGVYIANPRESGEQHLAGCVFYSTAEGSNGSRLRLGEVHPIVFSETVAGLWAAVGRR